MTKKVFTCVTVFMTVLTFSSMDTEGQASVVYKRNPITNQLEIYESTGGFPTGSALYSLEKNVWGYFEIKDLRQNPAHLNVKLDPYSRRPNYEVISSRKPYKIDYSLLISQLNEMNKSVEYNASLTNTSGTNDLKRIRELGTIEDGETKELIKLFTSIAEFPSTIKDGWHKAFGYYNTDELSFFGSNKLMRFYYYVYTELGKPIYIFRLIDNKAAILSATKVKTDILGSISKCQLTFKESKASSYETIYFLDEAIDHNYTLNITPAFLNVKLFDGVKNVIGFLYNEASTPYGNIGSVDDFIKIANLPRQYTLIFLENDEWILLPVGNTTYSLKVSTGDYRYCWNIENIFVKPNETVYKSIGLK